MHATLCDYIADIAHNAVEAGAGRVELTIETGGDQLVVTVRDNGKGMSEATLAKAENPFWTEPGKHCARSVGLGLPFLRQAVDQVGGDMTVNTAPGKGTTVKFSLPASHWDTPPLGNLAGALTGLMSFAADAELAIRREHKGQSYEITRGELVEALGGLERADELALAKQFFQSQEAYLSTDSEKRGQA